MMITKILKWFIPLPLAPPFFVLLGRVLPPPQIEAYDTPSGLFLQFLNSCHHLDMLLLLGLELPVKGLVCGVAGAAPFDFLG
jgi:hypothetical protein